MRVDYSSIGRALSAPARSVFLGVLMDGSSRPASELATAAGVRASTASEHLALLTAAGLVTSVARGRQRLYRLADASVAAALEQLGQLCPPLPVTSLRQSRQARDLAAARLCYDHLAGKLGVVIADAMVDDGWLTADDLRLTSDGEAGLHAVGVDVAGARSGRRPLTRSCPDWTERRPHLAGALGAALAQHAIDRRWVQRRDGSRGLAVTPAGGEALARLWRIDASRLER